MSEAEALVAAYEAADDEDEKPDLISDLEPFFDQGPVRSLLVRVISDAAEYDLARIEALRVLEVQQPPEAERSSTPHRAGAFIQGETTRFIA